MNFTKKQKGFTVIEIVFVIGVIAIIGSLTFNEIRHAIEEQRGLEGLNKFRSIYVGSLSYFSSHDRSYSNISISNLCTEGYLDADTCGSNRDGTTQGPWGGDYKIEEMPAEIAGVYIALTKVPPKGGHFIALELQKDPTVQEASYDATNQLVGVNYISSY